jgi:Uma2 family endonuclease
MNNLAYALREDERTELLGGRIVAMAPQRTNHHIVAENIHAVFSKYLKGKTCRAFVDGMDVFLTRNDRVVPDFMVICNRDIIKSHGIHGVPDLIAEVLSPGTNKRDRGYKKDLYERCGVREYWLVDTVHRIVEIYALTDGKYILDNLYEIYPDSELEVMTDEEKSQIQHEFSPVLFPEMKIVLADIFEDADF